MQGFFARRYGEVDWFFLPDDERGIDDGDDKIWLGCGQGDVAIETVSRQGLKFCVTYLPLFSRGSRFPSYTPFEDTLSFMSASE